MKRILFVGMVLGLGLALSAMSYRAQTSAVAAELLAMNRPAGEYGLMLRLNGSPVKLGVITSSDGSSKTNASTAVVFTVPSSDIVDVVCDAAVSCIEASAASVTITSASFGVPVASGVDRFIVLKDHALPTTTTTTLACAGAGSFNCAVFEMQ